MANEHALSVWRKSQDPKLSQEELAEKLGVTRWMVNSIETGRRRPSWDLVDRIISLTAGVVTANDFAREAAE